VTEDSLPVTSDRGRKVIFPKFSQCESVRDSNLEKYVNIEEYLECLEHVGSFGDTGAGKCGNLSLFGGVDAMKDQSYFLYDIPPSTYEHILYPLGNLTKKQVREIAKREKLPTADRPDSTGICFIGEVNVEKFLKERISEHEGSVVNRAGEVIGKHKGVEFYTIGQRHGFAVRLANPDLSKDLLKGSPLPPSGGGVPPQRALLYKSSLYDSSSRPPYYVIGKNVKKNELIVGMGEECKTNQFLVRIDRNFQFSIFNFQLFVRIRNLGEFIPCRVTSEEAKSNRLEVTLEYSVFGIAPGQCAVFYRKWPAMGDQCPVWQVVGGGVIGAN
jgi:tRNA-specific 2-thiouridylase